MNALLIVMLPLFIVVKIGLGGAMQGVLQLLATHANPIISILIFLIFFALIFYIPALIVVLTTSSIGALASFSFSKILDGLTWRQLRASAFGDDCQVEAIIGTGIQPMWLTAQKPALPKSLSEEISAFSDLQAAQSVARFRSALNVLAFANGAQERSDMLSRYLTWDELIHTSYFQVPRFRKLVAYAISTAKGFRATEQFLGDPDYSVVQRWYEDLQPAKKADGLQPESIPPSKSVEPQTVLPLEPK